MPYFKINEESTLRREEIVEARDEGEARAVEMCQGWHEVEPEDVVRVVELLPDDAPEVLEYRGIEG